MRNVTGAEAAHLEELKRRERDYWWHVNKRVIVRRLLARYAPLAGSVLEVGSGGGLLASVLTGEGWRVVVGDISPAAARFASRQGVSRAVVFDAGSTWPFRSDAFDVLLMLDLLEHVQDAEGCLTQAMRVLCGGGVLLLTVPAHPFLFSGWDRAVGHKRRYTAQGLRSAAQVAGFRAERISYWNAVSLFPALLLRGKSRVLGSECRRAEFPDVPETINTCLKWWGRIEGRWMSRMDLAFGLSLVAVLRKVRSRHGA